MTFMQQLCFYDVWLVKFLMQVIEKWIDNILCKFNSKVHFNLFLIFIWEAG